MARGVEYRRQLVGVTLQKNGKSGSIYDAGWSSLVARRAHNPEVVSSNLTPATSYLKQLQGLADFGRQVLFIELH
jgi:hypothetical protein